MSATSDSAADSRTVTPVATVFTPAEQITLRQLRARYRAGRDLFDAHELAWLRFMRWLYQTGRAGA
jgi:hypothetical protein